jgi:hypothetical protein
MSAEQQRRALLGALVLLGVIVAWQYLGSSPPADPVAAAARRPVTTAPPAPADVQIEALGAPAAAPVGPTRNPFVFAAREVAPPPSAPRGPAEPIAPPVVAPPGPPPLPPIPLKFIGVVEGAASGSRIAVLSDTRGLVVHGREGAIIDGRFRILAIGAESIDIAYADGRGRQTLRLTGQ